MLSDALTKSSHKASGLRLPAHQDTGVPEIHRTEVVTIQSSSVPSFGSSFTIDFCREVNTLIVENTLSLQLSSLVDASGTNINFVPAQFMIERIDYNCGGTTLETYYPEQNFLLPQIFQRDSDRLVANCAVGLYSSATQRNALATQAGGFTYYIPLYDYFKVHQHFPVLEATHQHQMRVFLRPLADIALGTTAARTCSVISCNLLQRVVRMRESESDHLRKEMVMYKSLNVKFQDVKRQIYTVASGSLSANINLQSITGKVSALMFMVRSINPYGNGLTDFKPISNFQILNGSGTNIVGGQTISSAQSMLVNGNRYSRSSYFSENAFGPVNNNVNIYLYSFSHDPEACLLHGISDGSYPFSGTETLQINFVSATPAPYQVDILSFVDSALQISRTGIQKIAL